MISRILPGLFAAALLLPPVANAQVHEGLLGNGLKVIVKEDHRAPVVVSQIWYKVGSSYEHGGITGVSHLLEHMMFKGTTAHPAGEFSRIIAEQGGRENAFTARDFTAYFQQLEKSRLPISFELEADRMRNLLLPAEEFGKEVRVVMEERRLRTEDQPQAFAFEQFNAVAYDASPYQHPVVGWMDDLDNLKVEDLSRWYGNWYAPNNAVLVVVGDVSGPEVLALAEKHFGSLAPSSVEEPKPRREPPQRGQRRIDLKIPAELPFLVMGYKVPVLKNADEAWKAYALEVLTAVLDGGNSARLTRELVRGRQLAAAVGSDYELYARQGAMLVLTGTPAQGHGTAELEGAFREQIRRLREEPVSRPELDRIKAQVTAAKVYEKDSVFYQAMQIGMLETVGLDWRLSDEYVARVAEVTPEQVQQVAREFLVDERLTVATVDPQPLDGRHPLPSAEGAPHAAR